MEKNYIVRGEFFRSNLTPDLKKGDRVHTDFFRQGDRRIFIIKEVRKRQDTSSGVAVSLATYVCKCCGAEEAAPERIDGAWAIPIGAKVHKEKKR